MIKLVNISKSYNRKVIDNINISIPAGTITCLAGANGSGKSTIISVLTNMVKPDEGKILLYDQEINNANFSLLNIGYVPQHNYLFKDLTAHENIEFWCKAFNKKYTPLLLTENLDTKAKNLSGGQQKLLSIEIALISNPKYLVLDEPTSSLDLKYQKIIIDLIHTYAKNGTGIFFTSHYAEEIFYSDFLYILKDGSIIFQDSPKTLGKFENFNNSLYNLL